MMAGVNADLRYLLRDEAGQVYAHSNARCAAALEWWECEAQQLLGRSPVDTSSLSTAELAHRAYLLQQPPPSLWQRFRRRGRKR